MDIIERFLNYTKYDTQSAEDSQTVPSTAKQLVFAEYLKKELEAEGLSDVVMDDKGYIYATLKANIEERGKRREERVPTIGFISHYDTSPDCSGADVKARIVNNYNGGDIILRGERREERGERIVEGGERREERREERGERREEIVMSPKKFPELLSHVGEDLIVTDGTTLLGADDKAGIAEIVQAMVYLQEHKEIKHGDIRVAFNPDEEIGMGAHHFDVERFGCQWAYTMDGGDVGELEFENFNAASAKIYIKGVSVHPGYAKGKMVNANRLAAEFAALLPADETPETTEGYQGFYHLTAIQGNVEQATLSYIIRDHDRDRFEDRKRAIQNAVIAMNERYGEGTVTAEVKDQYYNMKEKIEPQMHVIDVVLHAMQAVGVAPKVKPIRGGTDGAQLSFRGLPCPNIFAGGVNFHGPYEFVSIQSMEKAMQVIVKICELTADYNA